MLLDPNIYRVMKGSFHSIWQANWLDAAGYLSPPTSLIDAIAGDTSQGFQGAADSAWQIGLTYQPFNTLRLRQNGRHFTDNIFKCIDMNENLWIFNKSSMKYMFLKV